MLERLVGQGCNADAFIKRYTRTPEWRAKVDQVTFVAYEQKPTRLERHEIIFMSGGGPDSFNEQLRAGYWGQPGGYDQAGMPWWPFEEVWSRLSEERRSQLEYIAGQSLSS
ncbi:hypothetical protein [Mycobacterium sp. TY815]|uniref:hypothetical protein n=1 Tax=Mycobacterium sp. TY815 TaxID=3050581 RepID=UPI00274237EC|nr:hypothetical protein [Mycobacterium sp. TY815]MDP7701317.1 hypothetical protein [Mycobacterium sp. TY815]